MVNYLKYFLCILFVGNANMLFGQKELPLPEIPDTLETRQQKITYLLSHFWDAMDWQDPALRTDTLFVEQNLSNFFSVMAMADSVSNTAGVSALMSQSAINPEVSKTIARIAETYLYNIDSPYYNAESYLPFAKYLKEDAEMDEGVKSRAQYAYGQIMTNRVGNRASDFQFIDRKGNTRHLDDFRNNGKYKLLMFYDTDCRDCHELKRRLNSDGLITRLLIQGKLEILAIDSYGIEKKDWLQDAESWPKDWIAGWSPDGDVDAEEIYILQTSPTLYLLDPGLTVLGKDLKYENLGDLLRF